MKPKKNRMHLFVVLAHAFCLCVCAHAWAAAERFHEGVAFYEAGDYAAAARVFEAVVASAPARVVPVAAWYNLGNCHYREGRLGWARYCYARALRARWYDQDIRHNLAFVERKAGVFEDEGLLLGLFRFPSVKHLGVVVLLCNVVCFGLFTAFSITAWVPMRRAGVLAAVVLAGIGAWYGARYGEVARRIGFVGEEAAISSAPDTVPGVRSAPLPEGERVVILSDKDGWFAVYVPRSRTQGWVRSSVVRELP